MRTSFVPHYFNIFPTGNIPVPVCIGDLPLSDYVVSNTTLTEDVADFLEGNPLVPGAIMTFNGRLNGVVPRFKMFERLGHRYGVELFLRKPIQEMCDELRAEVLSLKSHLAINMAVRLALSRTQDHIYDPLVVEFENGSLRLLDMYVLLLSQSQLSNNLSGVVSALNNIEMILGNENADPRATLDLIMENLAGVVPAHHVRIILRNHGDFEHLGVHALVEFRQEQLEKFSIYKSIMQMNQPTVLEDVQMVPVWLKTEAPVNIRSWMGLPISNIGGTCGLLTLARTTFSPFTNNEKEIAQVFARYIGQLLVNASNRAERIRLLERKYQVR